MLVFEKETNYSSFQKQKMYSILSLLFKNCIANQNYPTFNGSHLSDALKEVLWGEMAEKSYGPAFVTLSRGLCRILLRILIPIFSKVWIIGIRIREAQPGRCTERFKSLVLNILVNS